MTWMQKLKLTLAVLALAVSAAQAHAESITVVLFGSTFYGAPYAVAREKGYFKDAGVDIDNILSSAGGGSTVRNAQASDIPFGEVGLVSAVEAIRAGQPLKIISAGVQATETLWAVKKDSPISTVKDLVGKKVGYTSPTSVTYMYIVSTLRKHGIKPEDVTLVAAGGVGASATGVLSGALDAGIVIEPIWSINKDKLKPLFWVREELLPKMNETVGVVDVNYAKANPGKIKAILEGRRKAVQFIMKNPDEAADIVAKAYNMKPELIREVFHNYITLNYWSEGAINYEGMERVVDLLRQNGNIKDAVNWDTMVDKSYLPADLQK